MTTRQDTEGSPGIAAVTVNAPTSAASKTSDMPKPVETVMKVVATMTPSASEKGKASPEQAVAAQATEAAAGSRAPRFALMAASIAFAGAFGALSGALALALIERPGPAAPQLEALDLTLVQDTIASLRAELSAIKSSVESSNQNVNTQLAKFTERLEKRVQTSAVTPAQSPAPARASGDVTGSIRSQQAAATAGTPPPRLIEDWVVRRVSGGVAVIQGSAGPIEVATGDIVPGIGRIESIRRQGGRWVVLTKSGMITTPAAR